MLIDKIIGTGEIGIADFRWDDPPLEQIIHITVQTMLGGTMSGKARVTHFHIGEGKLRLKLLHELLDHFELLKEPDHLTISSDSQTPGGSPDKYRQAFVESVQNKSFSIEHILPFFTSNTAQVLKLKSKGSLKEQYDADVLVMKESSLEIVHLFARGQQLIKDGEPVKQARKKTNHPTAKRQEGKNVSEIEWEIDHHWRS